MDPQATDIEAAKTPPLVLEYESVQRHRFGLTGWDWSLIVAIPWLVVLLGVATRSTGLTGACVGLALIGRMVVGVVMRDRSWWWVLYLGLDLAMPWIVDVVADYATTHGW